MRILATADVHTPRFLNEFKGNLSAHEPPDMFLFAGDMINRGSAEEYRTVLDVIEETLGDSFPIIGCFGNEEYNEVRNDILSIVGERMLFLDETSTIIELNGVKIGIVGTQGSLDRATSWQRRNIPGMKSVFERRAKRAESLLKKIDKDVDRRILLMHYSPCLETCEGEEDKAFSWLGSRKFYKIVDKQQPDLVVHGHVHNSVRHEAMIGRTLVRNVSFPAVGSIATMDLWN